MYMQEKIGSPFEGKAHDPAYDLVFAGPGPILKDGRVEGVHWMASRDQDQTAELFQTCDLFAFPAVGSRLLDAFSDVHCRGA